jgi:hypothetical protein
MIFQVQMYNIRESIFPANTVVSFTPSTSPGVDNTAVRAKQPG